MHAAHQVLLVKSLQVLIAPHRAVVIRSENQFLVYYIFRPFFLRTNVAVEISIYL